MKNLKKSAMALLLIFLLTFILPISANAYIPSDHLRIYITNLPEGAVYADLLISIPETDPNYTALQPCAYGNDPALFNEIATYDIDGYRSFTIHYKNAQSNIKLEPGTPYEAVDSRVVEFCSGAEYEEYLDQYNDLRNNYRNVKIVLLDESFKILSVSDPVQLPKESIFVNFNGHIYYDALTNAFTVKTMSNPWLWFGLTIIIFIILVSVCAECIVAFIFGFRGKPLITVLVCNFFTHVALRALHLCLPLEYWIEVVILETLVCIVEFLLYQNRMKDISAGKILAYTLVANAASLILGLFMYAPAFS